MKKSNINLTITLKDEQKKALMNEIHNFFDYEYNEDIGIIKQEHILDMFIEQLAPVIYNKALDDAILWFKKQQDNLESDYYSLYKETR